MPMYQPNWGQNFFLGHIQEVFTELLAGFNIRIKVYEKETFSVTSFYLYFRF